MTDARFTVEQNALLERVGELRRSSSRRSLLVVALIAVVVGLALLTIQVERQNRRVRAEAALATRERHVAEQARDALLVTHQGDVAKVEAAQRALAAGDLKRLAEILQVAKIEAVSQVQTLREPTAGGQDAPAATEPPIPAQASAYPQKVYIQFAGALQRSAIVALNQGLRGAGWKVIGPSGERLGKAAGLNEVRYHGADDRAAAEALANALTVAKVGSQPVRAKQLGTIYAGTLEVWISRT